MKERGGSVVQNYRKYQAGLKEGLPLDLRAITLIERWYGKEWNNYHEVAAEQISDALKELDALLFNGGKKIVLPLNYNDKDLDELRAKNLGMSYENFIERREVLRGQGRR